MQTFCKALGIKLFLLTVSFFPIEIWAGWARFYGDNVHIEDLKVAQDGQFVVLGELAEKDGEFNDEPCLAWVAKLDETGEIEWQKCYRGFSFVSFSSLLLTRDGGILLAGEVGDPDEIREDMLAPGGALVKLNGQGAIEWQKSYHFSAPMPAYFRAAAETETGFLLLGQIESDRWGKAWILNLDRNGEVRWYKTVTGFLAGAIQVTRTGQLLVAGGTGIAGWGEAWIMKLANDGQVLWQRSFSGAEELVGGWKDVVIASEVREGMQGEYWMAGISWDMLEEGEEGGLTLRCRPWIAKLDQDGHLQWRKSYGEKAECAVISQVVPTQDRGAWVVGMVDETTWLAKLTPEGEVAWQKAYGRSMDALLQSLPDGQLALAGTSLLGTEGDWLLVLEPDGSLPCDLGQEISVSARASSWQERTVAYAESPPQMSVRMQAFEVENRQVVSLPACPVTQAFRSCSEIQRIGRSYGDGIYPVALKTASGLELLGARCAMQAFGGGWMLIARQADWDRRPPAEFVNRRFGEYDGFGSFSIWPNVDFGATLGILGLSWEKDGQLKASLLSDLSPQELQDILSTSPRVDAWVR